MHRTRTGSAQALVLVALVLVAVVVALLFLIGGETAPVQPKIADSTEQTSTRPELGPVALTEVGGDQRTPGAERAPTIAGSEADASETAAAARPVRSARLVGRVVDAARRPLAGVEVELGLGFGPGSGGAATRPGKHSAVTDALGSFAFANAPVGTTRLTADSPGYATHVRGGLELAEDGQYDVGDLVLERGVLLAGRVVDVTGRGVPEARIHRQTEQSPFGGMLVIAEMDDAALGDALAITDASGAFQIDTLTAGPWRLRVSHSDYPSRTFDGTSDGPGAEHRDLVLELPPGANIQGVVAGRELRSGPYQVRAHRAGSGMEFGPVIGAERADVAEDGTFELRGLETETTYELAVVKRRASAVSDFEGPFGEVALSESTRVESGARDARLEILPGGRIKLRVVDARTGEPVEDFRASFGERWMPTPLRGPDGAVLEHHPGGVVEFTEVSPPRKLPFSEGQVLRIDADRYARLEIKATAPDPGALVDLGTLRLERAPLAIIQVTSDSGPVANARVSLARAAQVAQASGTFNIEISDGESSFSGGEDRRERTDENGVATLTMPASSGTLELRVEHGDFAQYAAKVEITAGKDLAHTVVLGPGGTAIVSVVDAAGEPIPWVSIEHRGPGDRGFGGFGSPRTDSEGRVRFAKLTPGNHRFRVAANTTGGGAGFFFAINEGEAEADWTDVVLEHGEERTVELVHSAGVSLAGVVRQDGVPLVGARVSLSKKRRGGEEGAAMRAFAVVATSGMDGFDMGSSLSSRTDSDGRYEIEDVTPGEYELSVTHTERASPATFDVSVVAGAPNRFDVELSRNGVSGVVRGTDGRPVPGLVVRVEAANRSGAGAAMMRGLFIASDVGAASSLTIGGNGDNVVRTDEDGRYELFGLPIDKPMHVIVAESDGAPFTMEARSAEFSVGAGEIRTGVDFEVRTGAAISVAISEASRERLTFASVRAVLLDANGAPVPGGDAYGFVEESATVLRGLEPGTYRVTIQSLANDGAPEEREVVAVAGEIATVEF